MAEQTIRQIYKVKASGQLLVSIPKDRGFKEGDYVDICVSKEGIAGWNQTIEYLLTQIEEQQRYLKDLVELRNEAMKDHVPKECFGTKNETQVQTYLCYNCIDVKDCPKEFEKKAKSNKE